MKKTVLLISVCLSSVCAAAQSTCETRVDAHPKATTLQRVNYCLTPDPVAPAPRAGEDLVFSGVTPRGVPQTQQAPARPSARKGSFAPGQVEVVQNLVPTQSFPKLTNAQLSEQEKRDRQKALEEERAKMEAEFAKASVATVSTPAAETKTVVSQETPRGLQARHKKPGRRWMQKPQVLAEQPENALAADQEPLEEVAPAAPGYAYDQSALPAEISGYTPYTPAEETPASAYEPYAPASAAAGGYAPASAETSPAGAATYAPAN